MGNRVNDNRRRLLKGVVAAIIVSLMCVELGPASVAYGASDPAQALVLFAPRDNVVAGALQEMLLGVNLSQLSMRLDTLEDVNGTAQDMADSKHIYYAMDHRRLQDRADISHAAYADRFAPSTGASARFPGWRTAPSGNYAELYKTRGASWRAYSKSIAEGNGYAAADIASAQETLEQTAEAADEAYGNLEQIQAESQINKLLNAELAKLQVDLGRELDVKTAAAMNEQQANADDVSAFRAAIAGTLSPSVGEGY
jgi:hypothetical protein